MQITPAQLVYAYKYINFRNAGPTLSHGNNFKMYMYMHLNTLIASPEFFL